MISFFRAEMGIKWGKVQKNPVSEVELFKELEDKDRILSTEEEVKLLDAVRSSKRANHLESVIMTALKTGMRKGTVEGTKNGSIRKIPITPKLTEILERVRKNRQSEYVFANRAGQPYKGFRTAWDHVLKKAGIENLTFHSLRQTFATRLGMAGTDLGTVQELMGHADFKMTKSYYHPISAHKREAVEVLDRVTTFFTTGQFDTLDIKIVIIGNH
jgi:integrase